MGTTIGLNTIVATIGWLTFMVSLFSFDLMNAMGKYLNKCTLPTFVAEKNAKNLSSKTLNEHSPRLL